MESVEFALGFDDPRHHQELVRSFRRAFEALSPVVKSILVAELLKQVSLVGSVDSIQDRVASIVPFIKPLQGALPIAPDYSRLVYALLSKYHELPDACQAQCLFELVQRVSMVIIVGAFATDGDADDPAILVQPGYYIFPAIPLEPAAEAICNACHARFDAFLEELWDAHPPSLQLIATFNALTYRQKLLYASHLLQKLSLYGIVRGAQAIGRRTFPLVRRAEFEREPSMASDPPFFELFDSLPDTLQSSCLAAIFRAIPLAIVVSPVAGAADSPVPHPDAHQPKRSVFPASPAIKVLPMLTDAYKAFGI